MNTAVANYTLTAPDLAPIKAAFTVLYSGAGGPGRLVLTGAGTYAVDTAFLPGAGAKTLLVVIDAMLDDGITPASAPVTVNRTINGVVQHEVKSPGSFILDVDPNPVTATTALSITYTAPVVIHVYLLG